MFRCRLLCKLAVALSGVAMLGVQMVMAAEACTLQRGSSTPVSVVAQEAGMDQAPCHELGSGAPETPCVQRCDVVKQSSDHHQPSFTPVLSPIHPIGPSARHSIPVLVHAEPQALLTRATAPPLSVRNCCFRT